MTDPLLRTFFTALYAILLLLLCGFSLWELAIKLQWIAPYHPTVTPSAIVPYCASDDGLFYRCSDPWMAKGYSI